MTSDVEVRPSDTQRLDGKTALVTGGSSGIGLAIARRLAAEGAHVYLTARREPQIDEAAAAIGSNATPVRADVSNLADLDRLYERIGADGRRLDVVVANAGGGGLAALETTSPEFFDNGFNTNVRGTHFTVQKALPFLNDGASVILLGSIAADHGSAGFGVYSATKAAIASFARTWAVELAPRGIRVNTISPGSVKTPAMGAGVLEPTRAEGLFAAIGRTIPMGRMGESDEVASAAIFLASTESSFITGTNLYIDGGQGSAKNLFPTDG